MLTISITGLKIKMEKIFSRINKDALLHIVSRRDGITEKRIDLSPEEEFIQVSTFKMKEGKTFRAHEHIIQVKETTKTQESWVVIQGSVKVFYYDLDRTIICEKILKAGDCSITLHGGHNYLCMEDDTVIYEFKTGPYNGRHKDKEFIN
tara:strand:+ start:1036 stop:1482 length:447 start_codon:yes stop_codon:yes gene_type:complete